MSYIKDNSFSNVINIIREYFKKIKKYTDDKLKLKTDQIYTDEKLKLKADQTYVDSNFSSVRTAIGGLAGTPEYVDKILLKSGGTMTGDLMLNKNPQSDMQASTKKYVDDKVSESVPLSGGTMTGKLSLSGDPTEDKQAATKHYVDSKEPPVATTTIAGVVKVGDGLSVTSDGTLNGGLSAATKHYVDNSESYKIGDVITTARTNLGNNWVLCNGDQISKADYPDAHALLDEGSYALYIAPNSPPKISTGASNYSFEIADDKILFNNSGRCDIYSRNGQFEQSVAGSRYLYYCNGYYLYYTYTEKSSSLRGNITWYYSKDPTGSYKNTSLYEAIEPRPNYQGMSYNLHNFFSDGTNCFLIGHYGSVYAPVDNIGSWKALDFGIGTVVYSTYIDGYYIFIGTRSSNFTNGLRICYTTTSPVSNPESTEKVYDDSSDSKFDVVGIYHVNSVWHIFISYTRYSNNYLREFYGSSLNNLTMRNITFSAGRAQILSISEQGFTFVQDGSVQYYDFNSEKVSTMGTLTSNGETFNPYYTFVDNDGVPFAFTNAYQQLYYNHSAPLPDISVDKSYAYIKVKE